jgi:hypothetical protein
MFKMFSIFFLFLNLCSAQEIPKLPNTTDRVSVTRSTDAEGNIVSGKVQKIDHWVPRSWKQSDEEWQREVFKQALVK